MLGSLIGAGASIIGGLLGKKSAEEQAAKQAALQKQFAQEGIQWKVEDAKKAGVHPLYALGASTHSYSPIAISDPLPGAISEAGNTIGRGIHASMSGGDRAASKVLQDLNIERARLENDRLKLDLVASQNKLLTQPGTGPGVPTGGVPSELTFDAAPRLMMGGREVTANPAWTNTEAAQKRWGEMADWVVGPLTAAADLRKWAIDDKQRFMKWLSQPSTMQKYFGGYYGGSPVAPGPNLGTSIGRALQEYMRKWMM